MVTDAFLNMVQALASAAFALFPTWTPDLGVLPVVNLFLPVDYLSVAFGIVLAFGQVGLVIWGIMKVVNVVRGSGA